MKVINIHTREIQQPKTEIVKLFKTLATDNDMMLATDKWSPMKLDKGLQVGSKGGHGPIKYFVTDYQQDKSITFQFDLTGFNGFHKFELKELETHKTELCHIIDMTTTGSATLKWLLAIRWLHDAYIEDAFDKVENHFTINKKRSEWNLWVRALRKIMRRKQK
ncbi:MAG: hypothetical protein JSS79_16730 [Bacteroidetes bacterium]|nr:hypothetical protein [Bacteroidota bacterium]